MSFQIYYAGQDKIETIGDHIYLGEGKDGLIQTLQARVEQNLADEDWMKFQQGKGEESYRSYLADMTDKSKKSIHERIKIHKETLAKKQGNESIERGVELA